MQKEVTIPNENNQKQLQILNNIVKFQDYLITSRIIGKGSFSEVKVAIKKTNKEKLAVKIIDKSLLSCGERVDCEEEIKIFTILGQNQYIAKFEGFYEDERFIYIFLEHFPFDAFSLIENDGPMSEDSARFLFTQVVNSVAYCHSKNIVHGDVKLENVVVKENGIAKLVDFQFSRVIPASGYLTECKGSPLFAAPELLLHQHHGKEVDVWALGCMLYTLLCGNFPFSSLDFANLVEKVTQTEPLIPDHFSEPLVSLIRGMLTKDKQDRLNVYDILDHPWICNITPKALQTEI